MDGTGVVLLGGSAGAMEALTSVVAGLAPDLPATVMVTVHVSEGARSRLPAILARAGPLPAAHARDGEPLEPGRIHVAPPGAHLLVDDGCARLSRGPRVNRHRPALDVMFASAARWAGGRSVAVVLSGVLDDGAVGSALVARAGGRVLVQDPEEAPFSSMPRAALAAAPGAVALPARSLGGEVTAVMARQVQVPARRGGEQAISETPMYSSADTGFLAGDESRLTRLACPECGGGLAAVDLDRISYYRCHLGHRFGPRSLESAQRENVEAKLWAALAALEEHAVVARRLSELTQQDAGGSAAYRAAARRSADRAHWLRTRLQEQGEDLDEPPLARDRISSE
ncbi:MAG TPA: chemotaxis protein CheB [Pseudonocardia sp.]|nr:chemotaxis protein CheB [Pseudonocardia sp.]